MLSEEIELLEEVIAELDTLYDLGEDCITSFDVPLFELDANDVVSNSTYDRMRKRLEQIHPDSKIFKTVTASKAHSGQAKIKHDPPLVSLKKASGVERFQDYQNWLDSIQKKLNYKDMDGKIVQSYKHDGVACALYYTKGKLTAAGLRHKDAVSGEDVLENVVYVSGVPSQLPIPISCSIRGELECLISVFNEIKANWEEPKYGLERNPANTRNYTTGSIRQYKDPSITRTRRLQFVGYSMENIVFPSNYKGFIPKTKQEQAKWANKELKINFVRMELHKFEDLERLEKLYPTLDYEVDGIVLAVNNLEDYEQMGRHGDRVTGNPKGAIAYKFEDEVAVSPFEDCLWSLGRTGSLTPVAQFKTPLRLAGTNVTQCSMHNIGFAARNGIVPGVKVEVIKSGKIIPKIIAVIHQDNSRTVIEDTSKTKVTRSQVESYPHPKTCPACGANTKIEEGQEGMWNLVCRNSLCSMQIVNTFAFFLKTIGSKGVAESQIDKLVSSGKVKIHADFYRLTQKDLEESGFTERQATLALAAIHMVAAPSKIADNAKLKILVERAQAKKKQIPAANLFASLGIPTAGKEAGRILIGHFQSFDYLLDVTPEALVKLEDIGDKTAEIIANYFRENKSNIQDLLEYIEPELPKTGKLSGFVFCLSGKVDKGRLTKQIEALGGVLASSVGKKVSFLVAGEGSGSKSAAALELQASGHHIKIIDSDELEAMF